MNAWRCNNSVCHHMFVDAQLNNVDGLLTCPDCGTMVCNVTNTKAGERFIAKFDYVPTAIKFSFMNKKLLIMPAIER